MSLHFDAASRGRGRGGRWRSRGGRGGASSNFAGHGGEHRGGSARAATSLDRGRGGGCSARGGGQQGSVPQNLWQEHRASSADDEAQFEEVIEPARPPKKIKLSPLQSFFQSHSPFVYDSKIPATAEFRRLCQSLAVAHGHAKWGEMNEAFADAMALEFGKRYGTDVADLKAWQTLCLRIGIDPVPADLEGAQQAVYSADFNLVDVTDDNLEGQHLLSKRTSLDKIFPVGSSKAGDLLVSILAVQMGADPTSFSSPPSTAESIKGKARNSSEGEGTLYHDSVAVVIEHDGYEEIISHDGSLTFRILEQFQTLNISSTSSNTVAGPLRLHLFFDGFPGFVYNASRNPKAEFRRLWRSHLKLRWDTDEAQLKELKERFETAMN